MKLLQEMINLACFENDRILDLYGKGVVFVLSGIFAFLGYGSFKLLSPWGVEMTNLAIENILSGGCLVAFSVLLALAFGFLGMYFSMLSARLATKLINA